RVDCGEHPRVSDLYVDIERVDMGHRQILRQERSEPVAYDCLVIALGCGDSYHGREGAAGYTESVRSCGRARRAGVAIGNRAAYGKATIVGAGLSGIEVAAEIRESRPDLNIRLLDRGQPVLKAFDKKIQNYVEDWFMKNDVEVIHGANV